MASSCATSSGARCSGSTCRSAQLALVAGYFLVPTSRDPNQGKLDPLGAALSIIGLGSLLFGIIEGPAKGWTDPLVVGGFAVGIIALASFITWELRTPTPMLDMRFFQNPRFTAANSAITLTFFAMFGSMFLMTQYWQFVHGYSPLGAGLRMIPYALTMMVVAPLSARIVERLGTKRVVTMGLLIMSTSLAALSFIGATTAYPIVISMFCVMAAGMGMTMAPATESVMGSLPREKAGVGSAVNDTTRQMGGALGVAVIGSVVSSVYAGHVSDLAERFGLSGGDLALARGSLGGALEVGSGLGAETGTFLVEVKDGFVDALSNGLRLSSLVILGAAFVAWRFLPARAHDSLARDVIVDRATADTATVGVAVGGG